MDTYEDGEVLFTREDHEVVRLATWAAEQSVGIKESLDRIWYKVELPFGESEKVCICNCKHCGDETFLRRHLCEDGDVYVYVGQCSKCHSVNWTHVYVVAKNRE